MRGKVELKGKEKDDTICVVCNILVCTPCQYKREGEERGAPVVLSGGTHLH